MILSSRCSSHSQDACTSLKRYPKKKKKSGNSSDTFVTKVMPRVLQRKHCYPWGTQNFIFQNLKINQWFLLFPYMCSEALGKSCEYWGAESSGPWGAAWLITISTGLWGYIFFDILKKVILSLVIRSVR